MWLIIIFLVTTVFYYLWRELQFFRSRGVKTLPPVPFFGNLTAASFGRENLVDVIEAGYKKFKNERYFGVFQHMTPTVVPTDPKLIKQIMCSDFQVFPNRALTIDPICDPLTGNSIVVLNDTKWKKVRNAFNPAFSPAKCRSMAPAMADCAKVAVEHYKEIIDKELLINITNITTPYMNDVILSCAFGFASNSFKKRDNYIYKLGLNNVVHRVSQILKMYGHQKIPFLMKLFKISLVSSEDAEQFIKLFKIAEKAREKSGAQYRSDIIQTLIEASKELSEIEQIAQAVLFFLAGYDTTVTLINYFIYEMAKNPDIQNKLCEIFDSVDCNDENLSTVIQNIEYLEQCINETLRKWPPVVTPDRYSISTFDFGPTYEGSKHRLIAPPGINVWFPIFSLHRDEEYWPDSKKFDPERFNSENKAKIIPYTYLPFGAGPRHCIGQRFAIQAAKVFIFYFFRELRTADPQVSEKICPRAFNLRPENGFNMTVKKRIN